MSHQVRVLPPQTEIRRLSVKRSPSVPLPSPPSPADEGPDREDGYQAGFCEGEARGRHASLAAAKALLDDLSSLLEDARTTLTAVSDRAALLRDAATERLALERAQAVLSAYWETDAGARRAILKSLLDELPSDRPAVLSTSADPMAAHLWTDAAADLLGEAADRLTWRLDPALGWTDLVARWDAGGFWGGLRASLWALAHPEEAPPL